MKSEILEIILSAAVPAITIILTWCATALITFLNSKREEAKKKTENENVKTYVDIVADNAVNIVTALNQTLVDELKAANADGKLTPDDANNIKNTALTMLINTLSTDIISLLDKTFGDTQTYLENVIEKTVVQVKSNKNK